MAQLSQKRLFLLDMDGTIYLSDRLFDRVPEFLARVRGSGGRAVFLTNNSSRGVEDYIEKLRAMGIETAPGGLCHLRRRRHPVTCGCSHPGRRCYVFGTQFVCAPAGSRRGFPSPQGGTGRRYFCAGLTRN